MQREKKMLQYISLFCHSQTPENFHSWLISSFSLLATCFCFFVSLFVYLVSCLAGWLLGLLVGWLVGLVSQLVWLVIPLVVCFICWLVGGWVY